MKYLWAVARLVLSVVCLQCVFTPAALAEGRSDVVQLTQHIISGADGSASAVRLVKKSFAAAEVRREFFSSYGSPADISGAADDRFVHGIDVADLCEALCRSARERRDQGDERTAKAEFIAVVDICSELLKLRPPNGELNDPITGTKVPGNRTYQNLVTAITSALASINFHSRVDAKGRSNVDIFNPNVRAKMGDLNQCLRAYRKIQDKSGGITSGKPEVVDAFKAELNVLPLHLRGFREALANARLQ